MAWQDLHLITFDICSPVDIRHCWFLFPPSLQLKLAPISCPSCSNMTQGKGILFLLQDKILVALSQWFSSKCALAMSGDFSGCHHSGGGCYYWHLMCRAQGCHYTAQWAGELPMADNYLVQNVSGDEVGRSWSKPIMVVPFLKLRVAWTPSCEVVQASVTDVRINDLSHSFSLSCHSCTPSVFARHSPIHGLHFPAALAAGYGHVTKFWPNRCEKKWWAQFPDHALSKDLAVLHCLTFPLSVDWEVVSMIQTWSNNMCPANGRAAR